MYPVFILPIYGPCLRSSIAKQFSLKDPFSDPQADVTTVKPDVKFCFHSGVDPGIFKSGGIAIYLGHALRV